MGDEITIAILCPVTSRGCGEAIDEQPLFKALLPSLKRMRCQPTLAIGYDSDDPVWSLAESREKVSGYPVAWVELHALSRNITGIFNWLARSVSADYIIPGNDDLEFETCVQPAIDALAARRNFGTVAFRDHAFPGLPTFYVVHRTHYEIFDVLYPLPWTGAHQDSWISDVYRPWGASEIDPNIVCRNHVGTGSRFDYGGLDGYWEAVMRGRVKVNEWLKGSGVAPVLSESELSSAATII